MKAPELPSLAPLHLDDDGSPSTSSQQRKVSKHPSSPKKQNVEEDKYGYGSGSPTVSKRQDKNASLSSSSCHIPRSNYHQHDATRMPRRSSLKSSDGSTSSADIQRRISRRASMGSTSTMVVQVRMGADRVPVQRRRSIDFDSKVEVKEVTRMTANADCSELWLQPEEFAQMKTERRRVVQIHKQGKANPSNRPEEDIRGLEKYLDKESRMQKNRAWDSVLLEQDEQELTGVFNDQRIADLYKSTTFRSPEKAHNLAKQDHEAVQDYLMSPRTTKLMMRRLSC